MNVKVLLASVALLSAAPAHAAITLYDGYAGFSGGGNSGTDSQGNTWLWNTTSTGNGAWGVPGLGQGVATYNTSFVYQGSLAVATDFSVSFVNANGVVIDTTPSANPGGYNEQTRFTADIGGNLYAWTPSYNGTQVVTFTAPTGDPGLANGDSYFVNVVFTTPTSGAVTGFTAQWSTGAIPETSTWVMMLAGFAGLGFLGYRRNKAASVAA